MIETRDRATRHSWTFSERSERRVSRFLLCLGVATVAYGAWISASWPSESAS